MVGLGSKPNNCNQSKVLRKVNTKLYDDMKQDTDKSSKFDNLTKFRNGLRSLFIKADSVHYNAQPWTEGFRG